MRLEDIFMLFGGLALFLYGMNIMSEGLEIAAGDRLKSILEKLTSNRVLACWWARASPLLSRAPRPPQ